MSWDFLLQKFPENTARPEEVPDDYLPPSVGSRADVASAVCKLFRHAESDGESFVTIERSGFTIEISLGDEEPCSQMLLHVHVDGEDATAATKTILRLADHFGMRAIDCSTSEFMEAERSRGSREGRERKREEKARHRHMVDENAENPVPPLEWLSGVVVRGPLDRYVYLSFLPGESPKQLQRAVFRHWVELGKEHGELAGVSGPMFVLTLPEGETFGDFHVRWYPSLVTETEAEMIPRVKKGAALVHTFAAATARRSGEIENGSTFVSDGGQRVPIAQCAYLRLLTDADFARKVKRKKKG